MPFYNLPLVVRIEPLPLDLMTENDVPISSISIKDAKRKIFIYKPVNKDNPERTVTWYKGEIHSIRVFTNYSLLIPIIFDKINAITKGIKTINYITTINAYESSIFEVKVKPSETGLLTICGISIGFANICCNHYVKINGVGIYAEKYERKYKDRVCEVNVVDEIPQITTRIESIQLLNGALVGIKEEQCLLTIYVKNISQPNVQIEKLILLVHGKKFNKTKLLKKIDLISLNGENPIHGKCYEVKYNAVISDKFNSYVFEFQFASASDLIIAEKREIPIIIESIKERRREEFPAVRCIKWDWFAKTEWPELLQLAQKALKNKRIFCCSEFMRIVVELQNQCAYNFHLELFYEDKNITGLELESWNNKSIAAEIPYDVMVRDKVTLEWGILGSFRKGKNLLSNFINMKDKIPMVTFLPVQIHLETEILERKLKGKVGDLRTITMTVTNTSQTDLKNLYLIIMVVRCKPGVQELINREPFSLSVSGQLTNYVKELPINGIHKQSVTILFTDRHVYKIGGLCDFDDKDLAYASGQELTFDIE